MKPNPTKSEELDALRAFIDSLPENSYLAEIMRDAVPQVETWIRSDLAWPIGELMASVRARQLNARRELEALRAQVAAAAREKTDAERIRDKARSELEELAGCARQILRIAA